MATLKILLPAARDRCGRAVVVSSGEVVLGPFRVLGTASRYVSRRMGNPDHERTLPFGDPPCGTYTVASSLPPGGTHRRAGRFGKLGALLLEPTSGEALEAIATGREQITLHGGHLDRHRRLRRTRGGLRIADPRLAALFQLINRLQTAGDPLSVVEVVDVTSGFANEPVLPCPVPATNLHASLTKVGGTAKRAQAGIVAVTALAMFGVAKARPTRRGFLAGAFLLVAGVTIAPACDTPAPCTDDDGSGEDGSGSGSGTATGSGAGRVRRNRVCDGDYGSGGGVG